MIFNTLFACLLFVVCAIYLMYGFKRLPAEDKQFFAVMPGHKSVEGNWEGINFTYYGLIIANSVCISALLFLVCVAAQGLPLLTGLMALTGIFLVTLPAARWIARWVEKKPGTFTVAGAWFAGSLLCPAVVLGVNRVASDEASIEFTSSIAAMVIAYSFGEGLGRLACISFGCCYGKPLIGYPEWVQSLFRKFNFKFYGKTKKVVYVENWEGVPLFPIQGLTALFYVSAGMISLFLFIYSHFISAFLTGLIATQGWRFASEFFRSDHRGNTRGLSKYQMFSVVSVLYLAGWAFYFGSETARLVDIERGIQTLWRPEVVLFFLLLWATVFIYFGKSKVTNSSLSFDVRSTKI